MLIVALLSLMNTPLWICSKRNNWRIFRTFGLTPLILQTTKSKLINIKMIPWFLACTYSYCPRDKSQKNAQTGLFIVWFISPVIVTKWLWEAQGIYKAPHQTSSHSEKLGAVLISNDMARNRHHGWCISRTLSSLKPLRQSQWGPTHWVSHWTKWH